MKRFAAVLMALYSMLAQAELPVPVLEEREYDTLNEAAINALQQSYVMSDVYEAGGLIYLDLKTKHYAISVPTVSDLRNQVVVDVQKHFEGFEVVSDYHTHPCNPEMYSEYFSPSDISGNFRFKVSGFMVDLCDGRVHLFDPKVDKVDKVVDGIDEKGNIIKAHVTEGRIIGQIPVYGPPDVFKPKFKEELHRPHNATGEVEIDVEDPRPNIYKHPYTTLDEAVIAAFKEAKRLDRSFEAGGLIILDHRDNKYYITIPYNTKKPGEVKFPWNSFKGWDVVGTYHTHACVPHYIHGFFSTNDAAIGQFYRVNMYMMNMCTGNVYVYDYRVDPADDYKPEGYPVMTRGRLIAWLDLTTVE